MKSPDVAVPLQPGTLAHPSIPASDLNLVLFSFKMRQRSGGRTCILAAVTPGPMVEVDCRRGGPPSAELLRVAEKTAGRGIRVGPIQRGNISLLYERTLRQWGRAEVVKTWGTGIRALRAEPRFVLHGGCEA